MTGKTRNSTSKRKKQVKRCETENERYIKKQFEEVLTENMETVKGYDELERNSYPKRCNDS